MVMTLEQAKVPDTSYHLLVLFSLCEGIPWGTMGTCYLPSIPYEGLMDV